MQVIAICKERNEIYQVPLSSCKSEIPKLQARARLNADINYYLLKYDESYRIPPEAFIENIKRRPKLLEISKMIERL